MYRGIAVTWPDGDVDCGGECISMPNFGMIIFIFVGVKLETPCALNYRTALLYRVFLLLYLEYRVLILRHGATELWWICQAVQSSPLYSVGQRHVILHKYRGDKWR